MIHRRESTSIEQQLREEKTTITAELLSLRTESNRLRSDATRLAVEINTARDEKTTAEQRLESATQRVFDLEATLRDTYKAVQVGDGRVATLLAKHDELETDVIALRRERDNAALELQSVRRQLERLRVQANDAENSLQQSTALTTRLQTLVNT